MSQTLFFAAIGAFVLGMGLFWKSDKTRQEGEDWSNTLQWGYLLMMSGAFGIMANFMSFTAVLLIFVVLTGAIWIYDKVVYAKDRKAIAQVSKDKGEVPADLTARFGQVNHFVDYMRGFFPIILVVFVLRTFVAEPFQIPSSSMRPGLIPGDFILVNKFSYGVRMPIINNVLVPTGKIERGDVVVFNYPADPKINYIKRIVALPGDVVEYRNKELKINGVVATDKQTGSAHYLEPTPNPKTKKIEPMPRNPNILEETIDQRAFNIYQEPGSPTYHVGEEGETPNFPLRNFCSYEADGFVCNVPEGNYFALGDNRDNSGDSRYWGFVPDKYVVGRAFLIWMNFSDFSRVGTKIQ